MIGIYQADGLTHRMTFDQNDINSLMSGGMSIADAAKYTQRLVKEGYEYDHVAAYYNAKIDGSASRQEAMQLIANAFSPKGITPKLLQKEELPDEYFRKAWNFDGDVVYVDMGKAREVHLDVIKRVRQRKFVELGFPYRLHPQLELQMISKEVRDILQGLRDIPLNLNLLTVETPSELKAIWPQELKKEV